MSKQLNLNKFISSQKANFRQYVCLGVLLTGAFNAGGVMASEQESYEKLSKQLDIMNNIFVSSLNSLQERPLKNTKIDNLYLAGQGVVFTVKSTGNFTWNHHDFNFVFPDVVAPVAPVSPRPPENSEINFEYFDDEHELVVQIEEAYEQQREYSREFRDQQRDLDYELRDLERESRDLAYQLRNVNAEEKAALVKEQKAVKAQQAELAKKRAVLSQQSKEMKKQQRANQAKRLAERQVHYKKLTNALIETLCTYGNSLKALPKDEKVSLVIKSAGDKVDNHYQDQIFVLTKRNITDCAIDKISTDKLLSSTKNYQF